MRELLIFQERDGLWEAGGSGSARVCVYARVGVRADSLNKRQFFQTGEERAERRDGVMKGVWGKKQLAPVRLCSYLIGMNNKCRLGAAVRRLKRGR